MENSNRKSKVLGVLAYLGILVIIPYLIDKNNPFVKFHIKQGLVLVVIEFIVWILSISLWPLFFILQLVKLVVFVLAILGIINVVSGKEKKLPLVGGFAHYFKI